MGLRQYYGRAARALSVARVIAGAIAFPTPASITWLSGLAMTLVLYLLI